ncbi:hypothetical protein NQ314_016705 [Rhamnusium bicolor]|uniref:PiggyBac transposable element-derived protein domain-containing protein n=1 Tax=Rhamnusium bicolor TaxID=1586634 RepID=A0AAV8WVA6_9CUCU|nr:hypothetical protein NQ314_016705 [Rhamnusium bicolor]
MELYATNWQKKNRNDEEIRKSIAIVEYNVGKEGVDISDQMASYFSPLRKTIWWYHKAVFELLLNTAVVNSFIMFKKLKPEKHNISQFKEQIILAMLANDSTQKRL